MHLLVFAHPYPDKSRANQTLLEAVRDLKGLELRSLYDLYPNFDIDVPAEQEALTRAKVVIWQHPTYWYAPPGMFKHWFDKVLLRGWAYGEGQALLVGDDHRRRAFSVRPRRHAPAALPRFRPAHREHRALLPNGLGATVDFARRASTQRRRARGLRS